MIKKKNSTGKEEFGKNQDYESSWVQVTVQISTHQTEEF